MDIRIRQQGEDQNPKRSGKRHDVHSTTKFVESEADDRGENDRDDLG